MSKPKWLIDREKQVTRITRDVCFCCDCDHYGKFIKNTRHKGKEIVDVHECGIHPDCLNTKYSICCPDFERSELV